MSFMVVNCSLNPRSRSRILAQRAAISIEALGLEVDLVDLSDLTLPICDGDLCYQDRTVVELTARIERAEGVLLATPIYNYFASASAKNLIELTGSAWPDKIVGFLCASGGPSSYMSIMGLANNLMLDFHCVVLPRFVYADKSAFDGASIADPDVEERLDDLAATLVRFAHALNSHSQV